MKIGKIVGETLQKMAQSTQAGMTTKDLDAIGEAYLTRHSARSAPMITYNYPGVTCISINDEAAHGIPGSRVIADGDLVKIDVSAELDGYFADANLTVPVGEISEQKRKLIEGTRLALDEAIDAARAGRPISDIGKAAENITHRYGINVIHELPGHGIGHALHEAPSVPTFFLKRANMILREGMVFTIEPHVAMGRREIFQGKDGWTLSTRDHSTVASFEHTIVITKDKPIIVTAV